MLSRAQLNKSDNVFSFGVLYSSIFMALRSYGPNALLIYSSVSMALLFYSSIFPPPLGPTALTSAACNRAVLGPMVLMLYYSILLYLWLCLSILLYFLLRWALQP